MTSTRPVVARFCPSPTGNPHVGMARTALFSWAFARHHGGRFVFRIEDTDATRDTEESYQLLVDVMRWLGLDWDEGPEVGGPNGPYRQSERMDIYADVAQQLLDAGLAYKAYDTAEELEERRDDGPRRGQAQRLRRAAPRPHARAVAALRGRGPRAGHPVHDAASGLDVHRPRPRRDHVRRRERAGLRHRARQRPAALHADQPHGRRADGRHPRAPRRGPAQLDAAADRAVRGVRRDRRRRRAHARVRPPAVRHGRRQPQAVQARPGVEPARLPRPGLPARGAAQLPGAARLVDRRRPGHLPPSTRWSRRSRSAGSTPTRRGSTCRSARRSTGRTSACSPIDDIRERLVPYFQAAGLVDASRRRRSSRPRSRRRRRSSTSA